MDTFTYVYYATGEIKKLHGRFDHWQLCVGLHTPPMWDAAFWGTMGNLLTPGRIYIPSLRLTDETRAKLPPEPRAVPQLMGFDKDRHKQIFEDRKGSGNGYHLCIYDSVPQIWIASFNFETWRYDKQLA